jgi:hypothetical protein
MKIASSIDWIKEHLIPGGRSTRDTVSSGDEGDIK